MFSSKFAYFLLLAVLYVVVCTSNSKKQIPISSNSTSSHHHNSKQSSSNILKSSHLKKPKTSKKLFFQNAMTPSTESTTSDGPMTTDSASNSSETTPIASNSSINSTDSSTTDPSTEPPIFQPNPMFPKKHLFSDVHCFIDDKLRKEVELFHVIGVRNSDSRMIISSGDNFNFQFFEKKAGTTSNPEVTTPMTGGTASDDSTMTPQNWTTSNDNSTLTSDDLTTSTEFSTDFTTTSDDLSTMTSDGFVNGSMMQMNLTAQPNLWTSKPVTLHVPNFNTPLEIIFVNNVTVAWDEAKQLFHFLIPDKAFRHYQISYNYYLSKINHDDQSLEFRSRSPSTFSRNLTSPYTCHFNVKNNNSVCVSIDDRLVTVGIYNDKKPVKENRFSLPNYLSFDKFFSYADTKGTDYILIHHKGQWIYRINYQLYLTDQNMFFKVFHLRTPDGLFQFDDFEHADEYGLVTRYVDFDGHYRYYYSLFSEVSGLTTYCVYDKFIDGRLMIMGRERIEPQKSIAEELRQLINIEKGDDMEFPTMLRVLFYCSLIYLSIFLTAQMMPPRKPLIFRELRRTDREIQRLAPVIETIMARVHAFLESTKKEKPGKMK